MNVPMQTSSKSFRSDLLILLALALAVRFVAALPQQQPNYMDAAYYYVNGVNLAQGRGFVEDFIWNYLDAPGPPPRPGHLYWMPLTSVLAWLGMAVAGISYRAAQLPFIIVSALLAPISCYTAYLLTGRRGLSWLAGLFAIFSGFYFPFWTAIDNFTPFAVAGSLSLLLAGQGLAVGGRRSAVGSQKNSELLIPKGHFVTNYQSPIFNLLRSPAFLLFCSGAFAGLAHLSRADGPLLLIVIIPVCVLHAPRATGHGPRVAYYLVVRSGLFLLAGYLLIMTPWFVRNWQAVGTPLPGGGAQTIWLANYDDLFSYNRELSPQTFLAQGWGSIIQGRWWALTSNLQTVLAVWGMIFLAPLALLGGWRLRWHLLIQLAALYAGLLFVVMTLVFAFPGARGGLFHSGAALLPFIYAVAVAGLDMAVDWAAARRRGWRASAAKRVFGLGLVVIAVALSSFIYYQRVLKDNRWNSADRYYPAIAAWVSRQNPNAVVMVGNPPAYRYHGGGLSVIIPNENLETTLQAAAEYGVEFLVLDGNHPAPLAGLYHNPTSAARLGLAQTFGRDSGSPIYVFRVAESR